MYISEFTIWGAAFIVHVLVTYHLYRNLGVLLASQGVVALTVALFCSTIINSKSVVVVVIVSGVGGIIWGVLHFWAMRWLGKGSMLILSVIVYILFQESWLLMASGRGQLFSAREGFVSVLVLLSAAIVIGSIWFKQNWNRPELECYRKLGMSAGLLGLPAKRHYFIGYIVYGVGLSITGLSVVQAKGVLDHNYFGLTWMLTIVTIVLLGERLVVVSALALGYVILRVYVWHLLPVEASKTLSYSLEMSFPVILLMILLSRMLKNQRHSVGANLHVGM